MHWGLCWEKERCIHGSAVSERAGSRLNSIWPQRQRRVTGWSVRIWTMMAICCCGGWLMLEALASIHKWPFGYVAADRDVGELLIDIHGQHAHRSLLRADGQRQLVESPRWTGPDWPGRVRDAYLAGVATGEAAMCCTNRIPAAYAAERGWCSGRFRNWKRWIAVQHWAEWQSEQSCLAHAAKA